MEDVHSTEALLQECASRVIAPSKFARSTLMPVRTPRFFARARGARVWDCDGREYIDFRCASNLLGYGNSQVEAAAARQRAMGDTMTGPAPVMVELAERMVQTVTHADWAFFAKNGTDVTTAALLIARVQTGRRHYLVAKGAYHGWAPWCTPVTVGVLPQEQAFRVQYIYNDISSLESAAEAAGDDLAAIFATGYKHRWGEHELPSVEFAHRCRELCDKTGALLIVDDIFAGFRITRECSWALVDVHPDLSCWGKTIANGYALSALLGSDRARDSASRCFLGGTFWSQAAPMAAALATIEIVRTTRYLEHTIELAELLCTGLKERASKRGFDLSQSGPMQLPLISFGDDAELRLKAAFVDAMLERGIYMHPLHCLVLSAAMTRADIEQTLDAADSALADLESRESTIVPHTGLSSFVRSVQS